MKVQRENEQSADDERAESGKPKSFAPLHANHPGF